MYVVVVDLPLLRVAVEGSDNPISLEKLCEASLPPDQQRQHSLGCVQLNRWYVGVFYIGGREGRCGVFRRLCVGMILGWDFYWFGVGRGCDVFLWGGRVWKGRSWGVLMYEFVMVALQEVCLYYASVYLC